MVWFGGTFGTHFPCKPWTAWTWTKVGGFPAIWTASLALASMASTWRLNRMMRFMEVNIPMDIRVDPKGVGGTHYGSMGGLTYLPTWIISLFLWDQGRYIYIQYNPYMDPMGYRYTTQFFFPSARWWTIGRFPDFRLRLDGSILLGVACGSGIFFPLFCHFCTKNNGANYAANFFLKHKKRAKSFKCEQTPCALDICLQKPLFLPHALVRFPSPRGICATAFAPPKTSKLAPQRRQWSK